MHYVLASAKTAVDAVKYLTYVCKLKISGDKLWSYKKTYLRLLECNLFMVN